MVRYGGSLLLCAIVSLATNTEINLKPSRDECSWIPESILPRTADHCRLCEKEEEESDNGVNSVQESPYRCR
jgi:hypothetical protein